MIHLPATHGLFRTLAAAAVAAALTVPPASADEPENGIVVAQQTPAKAKKKAAKTPVANDAECAFVGKRVTHLLARDDADAANRFLRFYNVFHCPEGHLGLAFRCVVAAPMLAPGKELTERVDKCWIEPATKFLNQ